MCISGKASQESRSLEPSLIKHWAVGDVVGLIGLHSIGHAGRTSTFLLSILPVLEALAERSSEGPQGELVVCRKGEERQMQESTPLMARKRERTGDLTFFLSGGPARRLHCSLPSRCY